MTDHMIRKQIYLPPRQNLLLKRLAKQRGVSEAEVIRQAIEREAEIVAPVQNREKALAAMLAFAEQRQEKYAGQGRPFRWSRDEVYEDRQSSWFKSESGQ
jgi:hypothetical protein